MIQLHYYFSAGLNLSTSKIYLYNLHHSPGWDFAEFPIEVGETE